MTENITGYTPEINKNTSQIEAGLPIGRLETSINKTFAKYRPADGFTPEEIGILDFARKIK